MFRYYETKQLRGKIVIPHLSLNSLHTRFVLKHKRVPLRKVLARASFPYPKQFSISGTIRDKKRLLYETYWHCETKRFPRNLLIVAPSLLDLEFFRYQKISETLKDSSRNFFGTVRQNNIDGKPLYPPFIYKIFPFQNVSETQNDSFTMCSGSVRQNSFDGKSWYTPLSIKSFLTKLFVKHKIILLGSVSVLWDKTVPT